jgi:CO/xanthine dehydrogenase FAD-binding subunit
VAVVDLQDLGLNQIRKRGNNLEIGATTTLQQLLEHPDSPAALKQAIRQEAALNIRNAATVAGTLVSCDGRSPFATSILALDAVLETRSLESRSSASDKASLGNYLPLRPRGLIIQIIIPLNAKLAYEQVARTPADKPIVCAAVAQWASGRTRLALGGTGMSPLLAMDGTEPNGLEAAARNAFQEATDEWASAEYRVDVAATLAKRCLEQMASDR